MVLYWSIVGDSFSARLVASIGLFLTGYDFTSELSWSSLGFPKQEFPGIPKHILVCHKYLAATDLCFIFLNLKGLETQRKR